MRGPWFPEPGRRIRAASRCHLRNTCKSSFALPPLRRGGRGGGRTWRSDKRFAIPEGLAPILERLSLTDETWLKLVHNFSRKFRRAAGTPEEVTKEAQKHGCHKIYGIARSREIFGQPKRSTA